jgi:hypothetical protein
MGAAITRTRTEQPHLFRGLTFVCEACGREMTHPVHSRGRVLDAQNVARMSAQHHAFEMLLALVNAGETLQEVGDRTWKLAEAWVQSRGGSYRQDWQRISAVAR